MKIISRLAIASLTSLALSTTALAAQQQPVVAELLQVSGKAFVESADGQRQVATKGMRITEGSHVVVLEKSKIIMNYASSDCKVTHQQNTLLTVQAAAQCATGQPMAVGAAAGAAIPPKTIAAGATTKVSPIMKGMGLGGGAGAGSLGALGAGAGAAAGAASLLPLGLGLLAAGAVYQATKSD